MNSGKGMNGMRILGFRFHREFVWEFSESRHPLERTPFDHEPATGCADATAFWTAAALCRFAAHQPGESARGLAQSKTMWQCVRFLKQALRSFKRSVERHFANDGNRRGP